MRAGLAAVDVDMQCEVRVIQRCERCFGLAGDHRAHGHRKSSLVRRGLSRTGHRLAVG